MACNASALKPTLPLELVGFVLEIACRATIDDDASFATSLQLVSRTTRTWLFPAIYEQIVIKCPQDGTTITPSLAFLQQLISDQPAPPVREHIQHIILTANPHQYASIISPQSHSAEWHVKSVAVCALDAPDLFTTIQRLTLRPRRMFIDSNGGYFGILLGCLVQQQSIDPDGYRPKFQDLRDHLEEVHTACIVRTDAEEQALGEEFTLEDACRELDIAVRETDSRPYRPNQLRVTFDLYTLEAVSNAVRLVLSIIRCPGVSLTLVLSLIPLTTGSDSTHTEIPARKLCEVLNREVALVADPASHQRLKIVFLQEKERPRTVLEYSVAVRSGLLLNAAGQTLEQLGAAGP